MYISEIFRVRALDSSTVKLAAIDGPTREEYFFPLTRPRSHSRHFKHIFLFMNHRRLTVTAQRKKASQAAEEKEEKFLSLSWLQEIIEKKKSFDLVLRLFFYKSDDSCECVN